MSGSICVASLRHVPEGLIERGIIVKVDRIITKDTVRFPYGPDRSMREQDDIHVVVFDESRCRVLLVMDKPDVIKHFRHLIAEERLIWISNFYVLADDVQNTRTNYIKVTMGSRIDHLITSDACAPQKLPKHCFDLVTISEVCHGLAKERGLIDVCGFVVAVYENGMEGVEDISKRELVVFIEDTGVLAVSEPCMLTCVFHGQCADVVKQDYSHAPKEGPLFAVVHYAVETDEEVPQLRSYHDATRVHFNPQFPELVVARKALVTRLSEKNDGHCLTLHTVKRVVDLDEFEA